MSKQIKTETKKSDNRADKLKLYSIGSVVLLIAIILLVNFLFDRMFGNALTFDFSDAGQNSLSQESIDFIDSLPEGTAIRVVGLFSRPDEVDSTPYQYIIPLLDDYVRKSDGKIIVEYIDPNQQPAIISQLDPTNSYNLSQKMDSFVVQYGGKIKVISPIDCYSYDEEYLWQTGNYLITSNNTEFTFSNAMYSLVKGFASKAYVITGLKNTGNTGIMSIMDSMAFEVGEIQASDVFSIPDDCDLLILNGPNTDISEKMFVSISDYLNRGGKMIVAVDYSADNITETYPRLNQLVNIMGINIDPLLVFENDPGLQMSENPLYSTVNTSEEFAGYSNIPYFTNAFARSIRALETPDSIGTTIPALFTSNNAQVKSVDANGNIMDNGSEASGQYNVAMYSYASNGAEMFVFGTLTFTSDTYLNEYGYNSYNADFFRGCVRELNDMNDAGSLNISTKLVDNYSIDSTKATASNATIILVIFMIIIPLALVSMAVIVYTKRKNL